MYLIKIKSNDIIVSYEQHEAASAFSLLNYVLDRHEFRHDIK